MNKAFYVFLVVIWGTLFSPTIDAPVHNQRLKDELYTTVCFESARVSFTCPQICSPEDPECTVDFEIHAVKRGQVHSYGLRRAWPLPDCFEWESAFKSLTRDQKWVCLEGENAGEPEPLGETIHFSWVWNKTRTAAGCDAYFNDC